jgi:hypothetical protein
MDVDRSPQNILFQLSVHCTKTQQKELWPSQNPIGTKEKMWKGVVTSSEIHPPLHTSHSLNFKK